MTSTLMVAHRLQHGQHVLPKSRHCENRKSRSTVCCFFPADGDGYASCQPVERLLENSLTVRIILAKLKALERYYWSINRVLFFSSVPHADMVARVATVLWPGDDDKHAFWLVEGVTVRPSTIRIPVGPSKGSHLLGRRLD